VSETPEPSSIASIAARGLSQPETLTPDEIQSLAGFVLPKADEPPPPPVLRDEARAELVARRDAYKAKADKRRNEPGFARNVAELEEWIAEIDAELAS
jgi:hypothetical protein